MKKIVCMLLVVWQSQTMQSQGIYNDGAHIVFSGSGFWMISGGNFTLTSQSATYLTTMANLSIAADASLSIDSRSYLTVNGMINNASGTDGLVLKSDAVSTASLLHNANDVEATIDRYYSGNNNPNNSYDYHLVSLPLHTTVISNQFSGMYLYKFDVGTQAWVAMGADPNTQMFIDQGYMIFFPDASTTTHFAGAMNNGPFMTATPTLLANQYSLVPNPYPSAINWDEASGWAKTNIQDAFWIWEPVNNNYVAWGTQGGAGSNGIGTASSSKIAVGQSFFVQSTSDGSAILSMTNAVRVHDAQAFYKETVAIVPEVLRLHVSDTESADEILVRFSPLAGNERGLLDVDKLYGGENAPQLYSLAGTTDKLTINALAHSTQIIVVPVGLEYSKNGQLTFDASGFNSFESSVTIFLEDKLLNTMIDLRETPSYTFTHAIGNDPLRFNLHFYGVNATDEWMAKDYTIWSTPGHIHIHIPALTGQKALVELFDMLGHVIFTEQVQLATPSTLAAPQLNGMGVVRVISANKVYSEKVFIR